jgi:hypothetical protein
MGNGSVSYLGDLQPLLLPSYSRAPFSQYLIVNLPTPRLSTARLKTGRVTP